MIRITTHAPSTLRQSEYDEHQTLVPTGVTCCSLSMAVLRPTAEVYYVQWAAPTGKSQHDRASHAMPEPLEPRLRSKPGGYTEAEGSACQTAMIANLRLRT